MINLSVFHVFIIASTLLVFLTQFTTSSPILLSNNKANKVSGYYPNHQVNRHITHLHGWNIRRAMYGNCKCWTDDFQHNFNTASTVLRMNVSVCSIQSSGTLLEAIYYTLVVDKVYKTEEDEVNNINMMMLRDIDDNKDKNKSLTFTGKAYVNMHLCGLTLNETDSYVLTLPRFSTFSIASEWADGVLPVDQCNTWRWNDLDDNDYIFLDNIINNSTNATSVEDM